MMRQTNLESGQLSVRISLTTSQKPRRESQSSPTRLVIYRRSVNQDTHRIHYAEGATLRSRGVGLRQIQEELVNLRIQMMGILNNLLLRIAPKCLMWAELGRRKSDGAKTAGRHTENSRKRVYEREYCSLPHVYLGLLGVFILISIVRILRIMEKASHTARISWCGTRAIGARTWACHRLRAPLS